MRVHTFINSALNFSGKCLAWAQGNKVCSTPNELHYWCVTNSFYQITKPGVIVTSRAMPYDFSIPASPQADCCERLCLIFSVFLQEIFEICHNGAHCVADSVCRHDTGDFAVMTLSSTTFDASSQRTVIAAGHNEKCQVYELKLDLDAGVSNKENEANKHPGMEIARELFNRSFFILIPTVTTQRPSQLCHLAYRRVSLLLLRHSCVVLCGRLKPWRSEFESGEIYSEFLFMKKCLDEVIIMLVAWQRFRAMLTIHSSTNFASGVRARSVQHNGDVRRRTSSVSDADNSRLIFKVTPLKNVQTDFRSVSSQSSLFYQAGHLIRPEFFSQRRQFCSCKMLS